MPTISTIKMTAEQFLMLGEDPPGVRLELVEGEVANTPGSPPDHSFAKMSLLCIIGTYIDDNALGEVFAGVGVQLDHFNIRRPDLSFCSADKAELVGEKLIEGPPDLAVEVLSPSSATIDRKDKFSQYRKAGVRFY